MIACKRRKTIFKQIKEAAGAVKEAKQGFWNVSGRVKDLRFWKDNTKKLPDLYPYYKRTNKACGCW